MTAAPDRSNVVALEIPAETDLVRVPDGLYDVVYVDHFLSAAYDGGKLGVNFRIVTPGEHFGKVLTAWYRVRLHGKGRERTFSVRRHSKLARDWRLLFRRPPARWDRVPMSALKDVLVRVRTRTVERDFEQNVLDEINRYSVVDQIIGRLDP